LAGTTPTRSRFHSIGWVASRCVQWNTARVSG